MTSKINLLLLITGLLIFQACTSFGPIDVTGAQTLECSYQGNTILTNHNEDGVDYIVNCLVEISGGTFTIEPGTIIEFEEGTGLEINNEGIIKAEGISGDPIIFRGKSGNSPSWRGIFVNSNQGNNVFDHVQIINAGDGESFALFEDINAAITLAGRISMTNSVIQNSGGAGIFTSESLQNATISAFENNSIEECATYPVYLRIDLAQNIDFQSCSYKENGENFIAFHDIDGSRIESDLILKPLEIPYLIEGVLEFYAGLTLQAGVEVIMANNALLDLSIGEEGAFLTAQGSLSNHVTIRGKESISGYWRGIYIRSANTKNILEYLDISDGGSNAMSFSDTKANIALEFEGSLSLVNCTSARSGSNCDILVHNFGGNPELINMDSDVSVCTE